ncbi:TetR/AcrR family transcriptional regulator [Nocardia arizonensis]|uniref:TetR/AcrR family transcriptional regulator n=1 Tax=Nocardia arizonensis TaxID=1141647 RepID=UPI0006D2929B|nr:TetR/AcrR family transcriptional regulator [Nocardia arizonensis]
MSSKSRPELRKAPRQQRSREMVRRIIDAGQRVLIAHGYDGASTNRIAEAAGISPGSLYQYFPNKDAIIGAVIDRYQSEVAERVRAHVLDNFTASPEVAVRQSISVLLEALGDHPGLLRAVIEQTPRLSVGDTVVDFEHQMVELTRTALTLRKVTRPGDADTETAAWLLVRIAEHLTVRYILDRPDIPRETFIDSLTRMIVNYFRYR